MWTRQLLSLHLKVSIQFQSSSIGDRIYESDWLEGDLTSKKFVLFIILRSRRPVCLRAETFSIVSLASFGSVRVDIFYFSIPTGDALGYCYYPASLLLLKYSFITLTFCRFAVPATRISLFSGKCISDRDHRYPCKRGQVQRV